MQRRSPPAIRGAIIPFVADVRPFRALRYAPDLDLAATISPPFDVISPEQQRALHERSPYNAVHLELAEDTNGSSAMSARPRPSAVGLRMASFAAMTANSFYLYDQQFERDGVPYRRRILFARLRLEPWDKGIVLPHEQTFGAPKEDRLRLLRAIRTNTSPVFLIYRDHDRQVNDLAGERSECTARRGVRDGRRTDAQSEANRRPASRSRRSTPHSSWRCSTSPTATTATRPRWATATSAAPPRLRMDRRRAGELRVGRPRRGGRSRAARPADSPRDIGRRPAQRRPGADFQEPSPSR